MEVSKFRMSKYLVLRFLFRSPKLWNELLNETHLNKFELIKAIGVLRRQQCIKSETIYFPQEKIPIEYEELKIAKEMLGFKINKRKYTHRYYLTSKGETKLALYEYKYRCFEKWECPWDDSFNDNYYREIIEILKEKEYFGKPPIN